MAQSQNTWVFIIICMVWCVTGVNTAAMEAKLFTDLMSSYNPNVRPVDNPTDVLPVGFFFFMSQMEDLNEPEQTLLTSGCVVLGWQDIHLMWDPAQYGGTQDLVLPAKKIWMPEFTLFNGKYGTSDIGLKDSLRVSLDRWGRISLISCEKYETTCEIDLELFPNDVQTCSLEFTYWLYTEDKIFINNTESEVRLDAYKPNGAWDLTKTSVSRLSSAENTATGLPMLYVNLTFERMPTYFYSTIIVPTLTFTVCSMMVFMLPAEAGEKISLGVTIMLSFTIVLLLVTNISPKTGKMPRITLFIIANMVLNAIGIICEVFVLRMYFHKADKPLPNLARKIFFQVLGRIVCYKSKTPSDSVAPLNDPMIIEEVSVMAEEKKAPVSDNMQELMAYIRERQVKIREDDAQEARQDEWRSASIILDRCMCIFSVIVVTISTVGLLTSLNFDVPLPR